MDAYLVVVSKREVRKYDGRAIDGETERRILEAGRVAGNSKNRQARRFVVLRDPELVRRTADCVFEADNVLGAALVVAIVIGAKGPTAFDAGRAAQNMMLAASNDRIGSCPNGISDSDALREIVGHDDGEQVATVLTFGHPATPRDPQRLSAQEWIDRADRKPYEEIVQQR
jgi:nitroreductase